MPTTDGVRRPLPPRAAREEVSDRYHAGRLLQRGAHLRGPERKPDARAEVPLERNQENLFHRKLKVTCRVTAFIWHEEEIEEVHWKKIF